MSPGCDCSSQKCSSSKARLEGRSLASSSILCLKDTHFQSSVNWPPEVHRKPTNLLTHNSFIAVHKSSPHFLCGRSNTTSSQPHTLHTFVAVPLAPQSTQSQYCRLTSMAYPPPRHLAGVKGHTPQGRAHLLSCLARVSHK